MELKPSEEKAQKKVAKGLNRTFYGIETCFIAALLCFIIVLIVPFMELKQDCPSLDSKDHRS